MALLQTTFANPDLVAYGRFGKDVAMTDNYTVIGAPFNDNAGFDKSGAAYVYDSNDNLLYTLDNPDPTANGNFGWSVAITDTYVVVGAYRSDVVVNTADAGAVYVFDTASGTLLRTITSLTPFANWHFGYDVAIEGNIILIGERSTQSFGFGSGRAYVYEANTGTYVTRFNTPSATGGAQFGTTVAMDENWLLVHDGIGLGNVFIYDRATYSLQFSLTAPTNPGGQVFFGLGIAIENGIAIIGAPLYDEPSNGNAGRAYVYEAATGTLLHTILNPQITGSDQFGQEVAISGNQFAVAAIGDDGGGANTGTIYIFDLETATLLETIFNPNSSPQDAALGQGLAMRSLGLSNNKIVAGADVGAITGDTTGGAAYSFIASVPVTETLTYTTPNPSGVPNDYFGFDTDISDSFYIVGAPENNTGATDAGIAYIYEKQTGVLSQTLINPTPVSNEIFGQSVSITDDYAVVGCPFQNNATGVVYIYNTRTGVLLNTITGPAQSRFGWVISLKGITLAIGAYEAGGTNRGTAYIYNVVTGALISEIPDTVQSDFKQYGEAIDTDGAHVVVGCPLQSDIHVYTAAGVFVRVIAGPTTGDRFGEAVAVSGDYVVVGASFFDVPQSNTGQAYVYSIATGALLHTLNHPDPGNGSEGFGKAVDIDGTTIIVGAPDGDQYGSAAGVAYFFNAITGENTGKLIPPAPGIFRRFGWSVAINRQSVIVGEPVNDMGVTTLGAVYTYQLAESPFVDYTFRQELLLPDPGTNVDEVLLTLTDLVLDDTFLSNAQEDGRDIRITTDIEGFDELPHEVTAIGDGRVEIKTRLDNYSAGRRALFIRAGNENATAPPASKRNSAYPGYRYAFNVEETAGTVVLDSSGTLDGSYGAGWPNSVVPGTQRGPNAVTSADESTINPQLSAANWDVTQPWVLTFVYDAPASNGNQFLFGGSTGFPRNPLSIELRSGSDGSVQLVETGNAGVLVSAANVVTPSARNVLNLQFDGVSTYQIFNAGVLKLNAPGTGPIASNALGNLRIGGPVNTTISNISGDLGFASLIVGRNKSSGEMFAEANSINDPNFFTEGQSELISAGGGGASGLGIFAFFLDRL